MRHGACHDKNVSGALVLYKVVGCCLVDAVDGRCLFCEVIVAINSVDFIQTKIMVRIVSVQTKWLGQCTKCA